MGEVYLARRADGEYLKSVAIKVIKHGMDTDSDDRRFRRERQILANLDHPNIAKLLDGGHTDDGRPYFVMDYIEGFPINRYCSTNKPSITERLKIFLDICSAVEYAHERNIVHRDIKPNNIIVKPDGKPKLIDFGIAKLLGPEQPGLTTEGAGRPPMTREYASPEQVRNEPITAASDIYSLGVLLYELLTGWRPYYFKNGAHPKKLKGLYAK